MKPKSVENYTGMESEEPFGDEMPNFDICATVLKSYLRTSMYKTSMQKPKQPPRVKIEGGKVQKRSNWKYCINIPFLLGFPNDARAL